MASKKQTLSVFCLGALAAVIAACASPGATPCEQTGSICPPTTHCAAAQAICIDDVQKCGILVMDPGEASADVKNTDGEGGPIAFCPRKAAATTSSIARSARSATTAT